MFQLSLASKELFHSNFLAWLCETYPAHAGRLFATFLLHAPPTYKDLNVCRDLVDKIRYAQLEQRVGEALGKDAFRVVHERLRDGHEGQAGQVLVDAGMTRGVGLFDLKYFVMDKHRLGNPVILGVQVQGNHFRLVVEAWGCNKARQIAKALWQQGADKLWFDFGLLPDGSQEYPANGGFNQYSGIFFYRSKRLSSIAPRCLVSTIIAYARSIRTNQTVIRHRMETVLHDSASHES